MKQITFIEFPSGWRPPVYKNIEIRSIRRVSWGTSKAGNEYVVLTGIVSDEDATYLTLTDPKVKIKEIRENKI